MAIKAIFENYHWNTQHSMQNFRENLYDYNRPRILSTSLQFQRRLKHKIILFFPLISVIFILMNESTNLYGPQNVKLIFRYCRQYWHLHRLISITLLSLFYLQRVEWFFQKMKSFNNIFNQLNWSNKLANHFQYTDVKLYDPDSPGHLNPR